MPTRSLLAPRLAILGGLTALRTGVTYVASSLAAADRVSIGLRTTIVLNVLVGGLLFGEEGVARKFVGAGVIAAGIVLAIRGGARLGPRSRRLLAVDRREFLRDVIPDPLGRRRGVDPVVGVARIPVGGGSNAIRWGVTGRHVGEKLGRTASRVVCIRNEKAVNIG